MSIHPVLFLDRDGTLIVDKHYLSNPQEVELLPGIGEALAQLTILGWRFFMVTNQSGVGRGYFDDNAVKACNAEVEKQLAQFGVFLTDSAYCPHTPDDMCQCRKPALGMWEQLQAKHSLFADQCMMLGDKKEDLQFGCNAQFLDQLLVLTGKGVATAEALGVDPRLGCCTDIETAGLSGTFTLVQDIALLPELVTRSVFSRKKS